MEKGIDLLLSRLLDFIVRALIPSSAFFTVSIIFDSIYIDSSMLQHFIQNLKKYDIQITTGILLIFSIGFAIMVSILHSSFDNLNKKNFNRFFRDQKFIALREKVKEKLEKCGIVSHFPEKFYKELTDYELYLILKNQKFGTLVTSKQYVDQVRFTYAFFISLFVSAGIFMVFNNNESLCVKVGGVLLMLVSVVLSILVARARYRSRNLRMYINFLLSDCAKNSHIPF